MTKLILTTLMLLSAEIGFAAEKPDDQVELINQNTIEQFSDLGTIILAATDEVPSPGAHCSLASKEALQMAPILQAMTEAKKKKFIETHKPAHDKNLGSAAWLKSCQSTCRCGFYASILEQVGYAKLSRQDQILSKNLNAKAMNQNQNDEAKCANQLHDLCTKPVMTYLKREAAKATADSE